MGSAESQGILRKPVGGPGRARQQRERERWGRSQNSGVLVIGITRWPVLSWIAIRPDYCSPWTRPLALTQPWLSELIPASFPKDLHTS